MVEIGAEQRQNARTPNSIGHYTVQRIYSYNVRGNCAFMHFLFCTKFYVEDCCNLKLLV